MAGSDKFRTSKERFGATAVRKGSKYDKAAKAETAAILRDKSDYPADLAEGIGDMFMATRVGSEAAVAKDNERSKYAK